MVSEKLDRVIAAEEVAAAKVSDAEKRASVIIDEARALGLEIKANKIAEAKDAAQRLLNEAKAECARIIGEYEQKADSEADCLARNASKNEMFGMNAVITKIIP